MAETSAYQTVGHTLRDGKYLNDADGLWNIAVAINLRIPPVLTATTICPTEWARTRCLLRCKFYVRPQPKLGAWIRKVASRRWHKASGNQRNCVSSYDCAVKVATVNAGNQRIHKIFKNFCLDALWTRAAADTFLSIGGKETPVTKNEPLRDQNASCLALDDLPVHR